MRFQLATTAATEKLGARLAAMLRAGDAVCLWGDLGTGKTTFARGAVLAMVPDAQDVTSPTYNLMHVWEGADFAIWHADLYRLEQLQDIEELGLLDAFEDTVSLIEWPDRMGGYAPENRLDVMFTRNGNAHEVEFRPHSKSWKARLHDF